jgi:hypothetical protein
MLRCVTFVKSRRFGGTYGVNYHDDMFGHIHRSVLRFLVTASLLPCSTILVTLMMEAIDSSEMSVLTRATRHHFPEDGILHNHRRENLKSYIALTGWAQ